MNIGNIYQDIWIKGRLIQNGIRPCENRYNAIKKILKSINEPLRILDFGGYTGYFSFRLAEDFDCKIMLVDNSNNVMDMINENYNINVSVVNKSITYKELQDIIDYNKINVVLALSVLHNNDNWLDYYNVIKEIEHVFIETISLEEKNLAINGHVAGDIFNELNKKSNQVLCYTENFNREFLRPLMYFGETFYINGIVCDGTGVASQHMYLWKDDLYRITGENMFDGTLNVQLDCELNMSNTITFPIQGGLFKLWKAKINNKRCYLCKPPLATWKNDIGEFIADVKLRDYLSLKNDDFIKIEVYNS